MGRRRLTIGLMLNVSVVAFEALAVATIAPRVAADLGGISLYGWLFSSFMLSDLLAVVVAGHAADRHGPHRPYAVGVVLFTAGLVLGAAAPTMPLLVAARAVQGLGAGALAAVAYVAIGRAFADAERARQLALLSTAWVIPGLVAPAVAGVLAEHVGWRAVFGALAALPVVAGAMVLPPLRHLGPGAPSDDELPVAAAARLAAGTGLALVGLGAHRWWAAAPAMAVGLLLAVPAFARLTPPGTARARRGLPAAVAARGLSTFALFGADAFLALALAEVRDLSPIGVGLILTPATLTWTIGSWMQARWSGRRSRRTMVTAGMALLVGGIALGASVLDRSVPLAVAAVAWGVVGLGMGLSYGPVTLVALSEAKPGRQGAATAAVQLTDVLGTALGTGIGGAIVALGASVGWSRATALRGVFAVMTAAAVLGVVVARRLPRDPPGLGEPIDAPPLRSSAAR